jgi:hypothetical protein
MEIKDVVKDVPILVIKIMNLVRQGYLLFFVIVGLVKEKINAKV